MVTRMNGRMDSDYRMDDGWMVTIERMDGWIVTTGGWMDGDY